MESTNNRMADERRLHYERAMLAGAAQYQDVIDLLNERGLPTTFTQTGGMNAALQVMLENGWTLLITDADDSLQWTREQHAGWGVGMFVPDSEYDEGSIAFESDEDGRPERLLHLVESVLRQRPV